MQFKIELKHMKLLNELAISPISHCSLIPALNLLTEKSSITQERVSTGLFESVTVLLSLCDAQQSDQP